MMAAKFKAVVSSGEHLDASVADPPHVLHASSTSGPPILPPQSTMISAAETASVDAVALHVQVMECVAEEYALVLHDVNHTEPSYTTHTSDFLWPF